MISSGQCFPSHHSLCGAGGAIALLAHDPATGEIQSAAGVVIVAMIVTYMWHVVRKPGQTCHCPTGPTVGLIDGVKAYTKVTPLFFLLKHMLE